MEGNNEVILPKQISEENIYSLMNEEALPESRRMKLLMLISIIFMLMTASFVSTQNMLVSIYSDLGMSLLGTISIFSLYIGLIIGGFFSPFIVSKLSLKLSLCIFSYSYVALIGSGYMTSICKNNDLFYCSYNSLIGINIFLTFLCGICCCNVLLAGVSYVDCISENEKSKYFGIFFSIQLSAQIFGNLCATIVIRIMDDDYFFLLMACIAIFSANCFLVCPNVKKRIDVNQETLNMSEFESPTVTKTIKGVYSQFSCPIMTKVMVLCLNNGAINGTYICFFFRIIDSSLPSNSTDQSKSFYTALVFVALGLGSFLGGNLIGRLGKMVDSVYLNEIAVIFGEAAYVLVFLSYIQKNYILCCVTGLFFGLADTSQQSGINILISQEKNNLECFSFFRMMQGLGIIITALIANFMTDESLYFIFFVFIFLLQISSNLTLGFMNFKKKKERFY